MLVIAPALGAVVVVVPATPVVVVVPITPVVVVVPVPPVVVVVPVPRVVVVVPVPWVVVVPPAAPGAMGRVVVLTKVVVLDGVVVLYKVVVLVVVVRGGVLAVVGSDRAGGDTTMDTSLDADEDVFRATSLNATVLATAELLGPMTKWAE